MAENRVIMSNDVDPILASPLHRTVREVKSNLEKFDSTVRQVALRIPKDILNQEDQLMGEKVVRINLYTWLLEETFEKLECLSKQCGGGYGPQ